MDRVNGIPTAMTQYPRPYDLDQFFGAYFHQDWVFEADDWRGVVDQFSASPNRRREQLDELADSIDELVRSCSESELSSAIARMGGFYDPTPAETYAVWLRQVAKRLRQRAVEIEAKSADRN